MFEKLRKWSDRVAESWLQKSVRSVGYVGESQLMTALGQKATEVSPASDWVDLWRIYEQVSWVRACVDVIAKASSARGWYLSPLVSNPSREQFAELSAFFNRPNPEDSMNDLIYGTSADFGVFANSFVEIVRDPVTKKPIELWPLDPIYTRAAVGQNGTVVGYVSREQPENPIVFKPWEVMHIKFGTRKIVTSRGRPGRSIYSLSPLESLLMTTEIDLWAQIHNRAFFMNGAKVRGLWTLGKATIDQVKRNREYLKQFSNPEFAHRDLLLEGENVAYQPVGASIKDMEFGALRRFNRDEILAVYGVPPSMVSIIETGNIGSGTGESQQQNFREETVIPQQQRIGDRVTQKVILEGFGFKDWELRIDTPEIIGETAQAAIDVQYIGAGVLKPEEVRQLRFSGEPIMTDGTAGDSADAASDPFAMAIEKARRRGKRIKPGTLGVYAKKEEEIVTLANQVQVAIEKELKRQVSALAAAYGSRVHSAVGKALEVNMKGKPMEIRFVKVRRGLLVWKRHTWPTFLKGVSELEAALAEALDPKALQAIFQDHYRAVAGAASKSAAAKVGGSPEVAARFLRMAEEVAAELSGYILGQIADGARTTIIEGIQEGASEGAIQSRLSEIDSFPVEVSRPGAAAHTREQTFASSAEVIARTDTSRFFNTVSAEYFKDAGVAKVRWIAAANPDPVCAVYKDQVYPLDQVPDGGPPVHHNCRCALEPVLE